MACKIDRDTIRQGIKDSVANSLDVSGLFDRVTPSELMQDMLMIGSESYVFTPKKLDSPYQEIIQSLNNQYSSEVVRKVIGDNIELPNYLVDPSEKLISAYEKEYTKEDVGYNDTEQRIKDEDHQAILQELGLAETSALEDFIDQNMQEYSEQINNFKKANPKMKLTYSDEFSSFDPVLNEVQIHLEEVNTSAKALNIPLKQALSIFILHEMAHGATTYSLLNSYQNNSPLAIQFQKLKNAATQYHRNNTPFEDKFRQGYVGINGLPYAFKNVEEFIAEAFSNPYFQDYLKSIPYEGQQEKSLWQSIIDAILKFFGFSDETKPSLYDEVVNFVNSDKVQKDNAESLDHPSKDWDPELVYRGMPKTYSEAAFELFTSPAITNEVYDVIKKLPKAIISIKKQLDYETNKDNIKKLQSLLDAFNDVKENDNVINVSINMLTQASSMAEDMNKQLLEIPNLKEDAKKLTMAYSLLRNTEALEFIKPLAQDITRIVQRQQTIPSNIKPFIASLDKITTVTDSIKQTFVEIAQPLILKQLTDFVGETEAEKSINQSIKNLRARRAATQDAALQGIIDKMIANEEANLKLVPNKANLETIFKGLYRDSSISQMNFEAGMMNDHPIANTVMKIIRQNNIAVSQYMLRVQNEHQIRLDALKKAVGISQLRSTDNFYEPIRTLVSRADEAIEDENGNLTFKYKTQKMLLSEYSPEYIKDATEKKAAIDYYFKKFGEADRLHDEQGLKKYREKLNQAYKARRDFFRENSEGKYHEPVLQMYDLLEKEIVKPDGTVTTFGRERGSIFEDIEQAEKTRNETNIEKSLDLIQEEIEGYHIKLRQLKSKYDENGKEKTGFEKEISDIANQYAELKAKYGKYELTEQGQAMFDKEKLTLDQKLSYGDITQDEYDRRLSEISVTELSQEYYDQVKYYLERINQISQELGNIPEFKSIFKGVNSERIKDGYAKIRDLVAGFRDNEMTIDGQLFSKVRPELVKEIQTIQQEVENLKGISERLRGLSIEDAIRAKELRGKKVAGDITDEELEELGALDSKLTDSNRLYIQYKELIDTYSDLLKEFSSLNDSSPSQYYQDELEHQRAVIISQKVAEIAEEAKNADSLDGGKYIKVNGEWAKVIRVEAGFKAIERIDKKGFKTTEDAVANAIARDQADREIKQTDWWKDNHYQKYVWTKKGYKKIDSPIYIWVKTQPVDETYIKENQPSIKFKSYVVNEDQVNQNYSVLNDSIPVPKKEVYRNDAYEKLKNATDPKSKAYFDYLEFVRGSFKRAQQFLPSERRLGDILPSFVKTEDELAVESTNNIVNRSMKVLSGEFALALKKSESPDEEILTGASTTDFFAKQRILPIRFSGRMDAAKQSSDIAAMVLAYELAAAEYNQQSEDQPLLEAIRIAVENLPVLESKRLASEFSLGNIFSAVKSKFITREKSTEKSNLSKTIDHILTTHVYGETKKNANISIAGMDYDLNKASRGLKRISSLSIFSLNAFVAVKNTVSAVIQGNINSNIGKGFFTKSQYNKAHIEAISYTKEFLLDNFTKFGNKTKIGQELDYFQVLQGASYNEFGQKTAWSILKNKTTFLTGLKNASEFELQLSQYLAMSKANPVQLKDGTWVEFRKAFELKNGTLQAVEGAKVNQKDIENFIFKLGYVNRVINGAYRAEEKNAIQKNIFGDLVFYLNGYVVPGIVNRFGKTRYSAEADMITRGYINQTVALIGDFIKYRTDIVKKWDLMSADERHRVLRGTKELLAIVGMAVLVAAMGGAHNKKELEQSPAIQNWALSIAIAVKSETETFVPIPGMGLNDMARKMNSPFAAVRQISMIIKTLQNLLAWGVDETGIANIPSAYYKNTTLRDGFHDKGDPKAVANFLKLIGWSGIGFDPVRKVLQQQNVQTLR